MTCTSNRSDLEISDDFGTFWRYLEQAPEMTIELDHRLILERNNRSMFISLIDSKARRKLVWEWKGFAGEIVAREGGERRKEREIAGEQEERNGEEDAFEVYKTLGPTDIFRRNFLSIFNFNFPEIFGG
ncbi:hypothetical protein YC2023_060335 [Brassica napus]